ncbi:GNAT family N-acetyltransferase [Microbacterium sp. HD4P20]|uniref:GNAT family N-acetyltransferase n=1 Tax=Microbacterium sp. HD4P20 TaxID=2864874 RepID=UPI001C63C0B3|nr:GNAT family N-acetyltransferase [Microbacterium sp. HD4P20]MCP2637286.1 GNAT family N-acetyltransferase [Microbacterium sp. HD4P20]
MVTLRPSPVDAADAHELLAEYFRDRTEGFAELDVSYRTTFPDPAAFEPPAGVFIVLDDDEGAPAGCGGIRLLSPGAHGTRYEVKHLYLRPRTRGRGWSRLLMRELESRARGLGARELVLDTHHSLEAAAALYARTGFAAIPRYNDNPNASRWYGKVLGEGRTDQALP